MASVGQITTWYLSNAEEVGTPALIFVSRKADAKELCERLKKAGMRAAYVTGDMSEEVRSSLMSQVNEGTIDVVACTSCWATGVDIPRLAGVVRGSGGSAPIGLKQESGRGTRKHDGKQEFTIWDLCSPSDKHAAARLDGYKAGGFRISGEIEGVNARRPPRSRIEREAQPLDPALEELLSPAAPRHSGEPPVVQLEDLQRNITDDWYGAPFIGFGGAMLVLAFVLLCVIMQVCSPSY